MVLGAAIFVAATLVGAANSSRSPVIPKVKGTPELLGLVQDARYDRDSCGSSRFGSRVFWTCRDTQLFYPNGSVQVAPVITSTGSWTDSKWDGSPALHIPRGSYDPLNTTVLKQYGDNSVTQAFYPVLANECGPPTGQCSDGTRYALWPDLPPMVTQVDILGRVTAYTWIRQSHIRPDLSTVTNNPATTLYRVNYDPLREGFGHDLPTVSVIDEDFYAVNEISFGDYGNVVRNGIAYLYGQANSSTYLAKVPVDSVEDLSKYEYYVGGEWTGQAPAIGQTNAALSNSNAGGQGTYYWSEPWQSYVWIGGDPFPGADVFITTAPAPEGPWIEPIKFYTGPGGDYFLSAYSIQANPALIADPWENAVYITYTKNDLNAQNINVYTSPLVYVQWE